MKWKITRQLLIMSKYAIFGIFIQCLAFNLLLASNSMGQVKSMDDIYLSLKASNIDLKSLFTKIEVETGFEFTYFKSAVNEKMKVNFVFENESLSDILREVSGVANLKFKRVNDKIYVNKKEGSGYDVQEVINEKSTQLRTITGKVTSYEDNSGLPGVNVIEKGTTNGTVTDVQGNYSLNVSEGASVVFSSVGYSSEEVEVGNKSVIDLVMVLDIKQLQELVVVGYGAQKERDVIGSISTIKTENLQLKSSATFDATLQGMAAGVNVHSSSGVPGSPTTIKIRGTNSINSSTDPLWIIDGMPIYSNPIGLAQNVNSGTTAQNPMSLINPADIESIQVLKDAAATAIYGSRASNGVIIITTKSGKNGKGGINIDVSTGMSDLTRKPEDIGYVNTKEWFEAMDMYYENAGKTFTMNDYYRFAPFAFTQLTREEAEKINTNWYDELFQIGNFKDVNISTLGGSEKSNYFISTNYRKDVGVQKNNSLERFSGRVNLDIRPLENITIGAKLNFSFSSNSRMQNNFSRGAAQGVPAGGINSITTSALPWLPVYDPNNPQEYFNPYAGSNPVAFADPNNLKDDLDQYRGLGGVFVEYSMPFVEGLRLRSEASFDIIQSNNIFWQSRDIRLNTTQKPTSLGSEEAITFRSINYNAYATYDKAIKDHNLNFVVGSEAQRNLQYTRRLRGEDLQGIYQEIGSPNVKLDMWGGLNGERYLLALFGRVNYKFKDKYLLGFSLRRDGTSAFTKDYRWGTFSAISAGWIISDENFMATLGNNIFLKLRGSYGEVGNQNVRGNLDIVNYNKNLTYGGNDILGVNGTMPSNVPVLDLTWEKTRSSDFGLDYGILNNRINGSLAWYHRNVDGMLLDSPIPISTGLTPIGNWPGIVYEGSSNNVWGNVGNMVNKGVEFEIHSVNLNKGSFKWSTDFNVAFNKNVIKKLTFLADMTGKGLMNHEQMVSKTGYRRNVYTMADWAGVDPQTGVPLIYVVDRDVYDSLGITQRMKTEAGLDSVTYASRNNMANNRFYQDGKSPDPTYFGGLNNTFQYKGFDLSVLFTFSGGNYIFDYDQLIASSPSETRVFRREIVEESWKKPGDIAKYPQLRQGGYVVNGQVLDNFGYDWSQVNLTLYKGDFIRMKNVQLGYNFDETKLEKVNLKGLRLYVSGSNLFNITKYPGFDPEGAGYVYTAPIPQTKSVIFGMNVKF